MSERPLYNPESEKQIITTSGYTAEDFFKRLTIEKAIGTKRDPTSLVKRRVRGLILDTARLLKVSPETIHRIPDRQKQFIKGETSNMSLEQKTEFMKTICKMERERIVNAIQEAINGTLSDQPMTIYLYGSVTSNDKWPNDIDAFLSTTRKDKKLASLLKDQVEQRLLKRFDVHATTPQDIKDRDLNIENMIKIESKLRQE